MLPASLRRAGLAAWRLAAAIVRDVSDGSLKIHASGLAYVTLVTIVPFFAISFSLLKGLGVHNQAESFITGLLGPLGSQSAEVAARIVSFIDNIQVGVLGFVGFAMLVIAVLDMMRRIETAFNDIWRVRRERSLFERVRDYTGMVFVVPLLISLSVAVTEFLRNAQLIVQKFGVSIPEILMGPAVGAVPYILLIAAFTGLYKVMPNTHVRPIPALAAGALVAVAWKVMGKIFSIFVVGAGSYAAIYSAFATLLLLMVWIYLCWVIVLAGASVAYYLQNPSSQKLARGSYLLTPRTRAKAALLACAEAGRAFYAKEAPPTAYLLAARIDVPSAMLADVLDAVVEAGLLALTGKSFRAGYLPSCPFDETTVAEALRRFTAAEEKGGIAFAQMTAAPALDSLLDAAETAAGGVLETKTLKEMSLR